jgi:hypothetical protein
VKPKNGSPTDRVLYTQHNGNLSSDNGDTTSHVSQISSSMQQYGQQF